MKTMKLFWTLVLASGISLQASDWETVDQTGFQGTVDRVVQGADGALYAAGSGLNLGIIRRSIDGGQNWEDCGNYIDPDLPATWFPGIATSSLGEIYASGVSGNVWLVRKSINAVDWTTVDSFVFPASTRCVPWKVATDGAGGVYVAGSYTERFKNASRDHWVVRRTIDQGATWQTVDDFVIGGAADVTVAAGNVFVVGHHVSDGKRWLVRKGTPLTDGTLAWQTIDNYQLASSFSSQASGIAADPQGNLYVVGWGVKPTGATRKTQVNRTSLIVRMLPVGGTWQTIDQFEYSDIDTFGQGITVGTDGTVHTTGYVGVTGSGWITRSRTAIGWDLTEWIGSSTWGWSILGLTDGSLIAAGEQNGLWTIRAKQP